MRRVFLLLLLLVLASPAYSQDFLAYGTFSATHLTSAVSNSTASTSEVSTLRAGMWAENLGVGVTFNFDNGRPVTFGFDFRGSPRGTTGIASGLFGLKVTFRLPAFKMKPYAQFSLGYVSIGARNATTYTNVPNITNGTYTDNSYENDGAFEFLGGVDYPVAHHLDVRVLELGIGDAKKLDLLEGSEPSHGLFTLNSGLVLHF